MFERILIALDGSPDARRAAGYGLALADAFGSRVSALFVIDTRVVEGPAVETLAPLWGEMSARPFRAEVLQAWTDRGEQELRQFAARAAELVAEGLVEPTAVDRGRVVLTRRGRLLADAVTLRLT